MKWPTYPKYKDSGVDWLGEVPEEWDIIAIKRLSIVQRGASPRPIDDPKYFDDDGEYAWVRISDVTNSSGLLTETTQRLSEIGSDLSVKIKSGDLFVSIAGSVGKPCISAIKACIHDGFIYFPYLNINPKILYYVFEARYCFGGLGKLGTQLNLNTETVGDIHISIPKVKSEIVRVIQFIDAETKKIDVLISEQEKLIALLQEKRQAVISHAVTKGLNPDAPMKDSGVEWLGMVPDSWNIKHLKHTAKILRGKFTHRPRNDPRFYDGDYPFIQTGDITEAKRYVTSYRQTLNELGTSVSMEFPKDTLVMSIAANIGDVAILTFPAYFPDSIVGFHPNNAVCLDFLYYYMISLKSQLLKNSTVSTQLNINIEQIGAISAVCPPYDEQESIVKYLDQVTGGIEDLMNAANNAIALLRERRTALISAAVTGKIDVRGLTASEPA